MHGSTLPTLAGETREMAEIPEICTSKLEVTVMVCTSKPEVLLR
jgi:hypothetical protein